MKPWERSHVHSPVCGPLFVTIPLASVEARLTPCKQALSGGVGSCRKLNRCVVLFFFCFLMSYKMSNMTAAFLQSRPLVRTLAFRKYEEKCKI